MKRIKNLLFLLLVIIITMSFSTEQTQRRIILDEFYSEFLSLNLIHAMQSADVLYHLSKEPSFSKELLESELDRIDENVNYGNAQISKMVVHASDENKVKVSRYLKSIDRHLAAVYVDTKTIRKDLKTDKNVTPYLSDIYFQLKDAEYQDHKEIKRILKFKIYTEPVIVQQ
ncbi:MAG: hypothetical protein WCE54_02220 [Ignavibacteriaceae bacterium]